MSITSSQLNNNVQPCYSAADFSFPLKTIILFASLFALCFLVIDKVVLILHDYQDGVVLFLFSYFILFICSVGIFWFYFRYPSPRPSDDLLLPLATTLLFIQALNIPAPEVGMSLTTLLTKNSIIYYCVMIFIGPFYEEVLFRGCLFGALCTLSNRAGGGLIVPALGSSLIFSLYHSQYTSVSAYAVEFIVAIILTIIRIRTKGLIAPIVAHSTLNLFAVLSLFYTVM
jgi:membrane protease YdiL (CAAX protease family)